MNLYPSGVWFADAMTSFSGVTFVLFCFVFVFLLSLKPRPSVNRSSICTRPDSHTQLPNNCLRHFHFLCLPFSCFFGDIAFSRVFWYHYRFLFVWGVRRTYVFPPTGWCFFTLWPRAGFLTSAYYVRVQPINLKSRPKQSFQDTRKRAGLDLIPY